MMANNESGALQPVEEIGAIAREADVYFHTDAVQAAGKVPIDVERIGCDLLTVAAHKMHGPQGVGALYVRRATRLRPCWWADATSAGGARARKTWRASWALARPRRWRWNGSPRAAMC